MSASQSPIDLVLSRLDRSKKSGAGYIARCPAHDDRSPSLSIKEGDNGAVLIHCHAGCSPADVCAAIGLELGDLFPEQTKESRGNGRDQFKRPEKKVEPVTSDAPRKLITFTRADLVEIKPTDWLIEDWLVTDSLAGLVAPSGACKSFLAIDWSCRIATGSLWFGRNVKQGAVFYLAGEGRAGLRKRIAAWEKSTGIPIARAPLYLADGLPFLCDELNAAATIESIQEIAKALFFESGCEPVLIVIDTVARAMNGANENAADDMGRLIKAMDWLRVTWGATVLAVHHTGHDPSNQERGRGSSAFRAALDSEFVIAPGEPLITLKSTKCKDWRPPTPLTLRKAEITIETPGPGGTVIAETSLALQDDAGAMVENERRTQVLQFRAQNMSLRDIAAKTGIPKSTVERWLKAAA